MRCAVRNHAIRNRIKAHIAARPTSWSCIRGQLEKGQPVISSIFRLVNPLKFGGNARSTRLPSARLSEVMFVTPPGTEKLADRVEAEIQRGQADQFVRNGNTGQVVAGNNLSVARLCALLQASDAALIFTAARIQICQSGGNPGRSTGRRVFAIASLRRRHRRPESGMTTSCARAALGRTPESGSK